MCVGGSIEPTRCGCVGGWRVEMNNIDCEIANSDPVGAASLSSLDVPAELDGDRTVDIRESTVVPPVPVRGYLGRIGLAAYRVVQGALRHREGTTTRHGADFLFVWNGTRDIRQPTCSDEPRAPARATGARGGADGSALGAET